ncbi:16S rRNA (guanine(966)-N(2))-methyltransferase RsmD [bacterium]|nr:16S rRNA (guanine(966)-N(2))-methyltransferase RsmD [bacterium]
MRVIAGELRGRRFRAPPGLDTRPTGDRVRESLFDLLGPIPEGAAILDLFAGSGALGIEALSRGAGAATFVERDRPARRVLRVNLEALGLVARSVIAPGGAEDGAWRKYGPFDRIFADPPYAGGWATRIVGEAREALRPEGILALEHAADDPAPEPGEGLSLWKSRRYGVTTLSLYARTAEEPS